MISIRRRSRAAHVPVNEPLGRRLTTTWTWRIGVSVDGSLSISTPADAGCVSRCGRWSSLQLGVAMPSAALHMIPQSTLRFLAQCVFLVAGAWRLPPIGKWPSASCRSPRGMLEVQRSGLTFMCCIHVCSRSHLSWHGYCLSLRFIHAQREANGDVCTCAHPLPIHRISTSLFHLCCISRLPSRASHIMPAHPSESSSRCFCSTSEGVSGLALVWCFHA